MRPTKATLHKHLQETSRLGSQLSVSRQECQGGVSRFDSLLTSWQGSFETLKYLKKAQRCVHGERQWNVRVECGASPPMKAQENL